VSELKHHSDRLREPLNETTRKSRRNLISVAFLGLVITKVGLIPEKISAFGLEFTTANQQALLSILFYTIIYFALSFLVYVYSELTAWKIVFTAKEIDELVEAQKESTIEGVVFGESKTKIDLDIKVNKILRVIYYRSNPIYLLRLFVELGIPIILAVYSCISLYTFDLSSEKDVSSNTKILINKDAIP